MNSNNVAMTINNNNNNNNNNGLSVPNNGNRRSNNISNGVGNVNSNNSSRSNSSNNSKKKKFYPKLIATQIVAIQCFHYFILTLLYEINAMIFTIDLSRITFTAQMSSTISSSSSLTPIATTYMSLDRIFTDQYIHLYHLSSYPDIITVFVAAIGTAYVFVVIVEKSKQCLDFAITLFICHLLLVWMYNQKFPKRMEWYIVHVIATIMMILLAEHLCAKRELDDIPLLTL
jgi:hypothetical protein